MSVTASATSIPAPAARPVPLATPRSRTAGLVLSVLALAGCIVASLAIGSQSIPFAEVLRAFTAYDGSDAHAIVRDLRVPRTELGLLVGAALGAAGAVMQGATRNALADPGILGINNGASLGVVIAISVLGVSSVAGYTAFALLGAAVTAAIIFVLGGTGRGGPTPVRLALAGAVMASLLASLISAVLVFDAQTLDEFRFWVVGSIAGRDTHVMLSVLPVVGAGLVVAIACARSLNAMALGDEVARSLGANVARARACAMVAFVLLSGGAVAAAGPIMFIGLAVPHIARGLVGPDHRWVIPWSMVLGAVLLLSADVLGRIVSRPAELEVGIVTALLGAPFFIWLIRRRRLVTL